MKLSLAGKELIKRFEGFSPQRYYDIGGKATIGYGHLIQPNEKYKFLTLSQAETLFNGDISQIEYALRKGIKVSVTQGQYDALVSLAYNWGITNLLKSEGLEALNKGDLITALKEFQEVNKINGKVSESLKKRRAEEALLFIG